MVLCILNLYYNIQQDATMSSHYFISPQCCLQYQNQCLEVTLLILNCKYVAETSNCTAAWKFIVMDQNVQCWR
jgi:hypothetical protein